MTPILALPNDACTCGKSCCQQSVVSGQSDGTTGDIGQAIIGGFNAIKGLFGGGSHTPECAPPAGCFKCQIKGQGGIAGCIDSVTQQWIAAVKSPTTSGYDMTKIADGSALAITNGILAGLSNPQLFTPQTDAYLAQAKQVFTQRANDIQQLMTQAATTQTNATTGGSTLPTTLPATVLGIPTDVALLLAGGGLVVLSLLRGNNA